MNPLPVRLATDGHMIVEEVEGRSFWPGQPYIADCLVSEAYRSKDMTGAHATALVARYNSHAALVVALRGLAEIVGEYRERVISGEITGRLIEHDYEALALARKALETV